MGSTVSQGRPSPAILACSSPGSRPMLDSPRRNQAAPASQGRHHHRAEQRRSRSLRPWFEDLEDRVVPSTIAWDSTNHPTGGDWDTGANWVGGLVPTSADDVVINLTSGG